MKGLVKFATAALLLCGAARPASAEWHEAKSRHFIIYADERPGELQDFAQKLERFDQAVRHVRGMSDPALTDSNRLVIYVLPNQEAVARLAGGKEVGGFYTARASGSVAFVPRTTGSAAGRFSLDPETVFFHEYAHHLQLQSMAVAVPGWVIEGFAEFFSTAEVKKDGSVAIGLPANHRAFALFRLSGFSLEEMLGGTYRKLSPAQREQLYARGWLLTHYLAFSEPRKGQMVRYIAGIQSGMTPLASARAAFGDLKALERELDRYLGRRLTAVAVSGTALSTGPIQLRKLTAGEAAVMPVRIRSDRGVNSKSAPLVASDARAIAARFPNEPSVQSALAEAEYDARNYAAAEAAADRALAANPKDIHALIYKGRARLEMAKANPAKADWSEVRSWFSRANKLDTEDAEPLMLFYKSYLDAGQTPTKNAVEALLYALTLVPQDDTLRINAVRQMLTDGRLAEAKELFAPLAFNPHADERWREIASSVMQAIASGDGKKASALLNQRQQPQPAAGAN